MIRLNRKRQVTPEGKWQVPRSYRRPLAVVIGVGVLVVWLLEGSGISHYVNMTNELDRMKREIVELEQANQVLKKEIHLVETDPFTLEKLARDRLGYVKEGEVVYQLVESQ